MPFGVASEHIQFFSRNLKIEFENLLNDNQLKILLNSFLKVAERGHPSLEWGFDIWRKNLDLKSLICSPSLAKIAGQLKNTQSIRFAYSQYLGPNCYSNKTSILFRKSCVKELICGLCLCLKPSQNAESPFFPETIKSGIFFDIHDDFLLKFPKTSGEYLFIFYSDIKARFYRQDEESEIEHSFKNLGYSNGDFLNDRINPAYRRIHS